MTNNTNILLEEVEYILEENIIQSSEKFTKQEVDLQKTPLFFPEGYENIFLTLYFIFLPYIVGILFLVIYTSKDNVEFFLSVNELASVIGIWSIGYEIIAIPIMLYIIKMAFSFTTLKKKPKQKKKEPFRRP